ncbi:MAG: hypothetical protein JRI38_01190 [Deltaproteobacteria bacterium]|nr:hypothetical protein [Deltaproteobacteria bacterium]
MDILFIAAIPVAPSFYSVFVENLALDNASVAFWSCQIQVSNFPARTQDQQRINYFLILMKDALFVFAGFGENCRCKK